MFDHETRRDVSEALGPWVAALAAVALLGACQSEDGSGGEGASEQASGQQAEKAASGEESGREGGDDGEVGPEGPSSIDHGGITSIPDDEQLAEKGETLFNEKGCAACHKMDKDVTGPALGGVTERREPEWIARMIMHPDKMVQKDPQAKELLAEFSTPMANQGVKPDEAKALIAYFATTEE